MPTPEVVSSSSDIIRSVIAAVPVIVSPIVAWALGRTATSRDVTTLEYLNKRLDLFDRVNRLQTQLADGPMKELLEVELQHYRHFLDQPSRLFASAEHPAASPTRSRIDRFFITQPAKSRRQRIFKGLFYFFFVSAVLGFLLPFALLPSSVFSVGDLSEMLPAALLGPAFYFGLALLCRRAAR